MTHPRQAEDRARLELGQLALEAAARRAPLPVCWTADGGPAEPVPPAPIVLSVGGQAVAQVRLDRRGRPIALLVRLS